MALTSASLKTKIESQLTAQGFDLENEHSKVSEFAEAIAAAVIDEITSNAVVVVTGPSAGNYPVT